MKKLALSSLFLVFLSSLQVLKISNLENPSIDPIITRSNINIQEGTVYDLSNDPKSKEVYSLKEATIIVKFTSTSNNGIQSLFSVSNTSSTYENYHFHTYITNQGAVGMEVRNGIFLHYKLDRPASIQGQFHKKDSQNIIAFKADPKTSSYTLFANGEKIASLTESSYKFIADITGTNNISLGGTIRAHKEQYPFGGSIDDFALYNVALSDEELIKVTSQIEYGQKIFYADDGLKSNYHRIPTLLTLSSGTVVASSDARYGGTHDAASNIDIAFSKSHDSGKTWEKPSLPLVFDDYAAEQTDWPRDIIAKNLQIRGSAAFIDSVLLEDKINKRLFLFADAYTYGKGFNSAEPGTGFKTIEGKKYLSIRHRDDKEGVYNYSIREKGVIYDDLLNKPTTYSVDGNYRIMNNNVYLTQNQYSVRFDKLTLVEYHNENIVNQCVFFKDSLFQLYPTNYFVMKYSDDEGKTWSDMNILGEFHDESKQMVLAGPGVGLQITQGENKGRLIISSYNSRTGEFGFLYSDDFGKTWDIFFKDLGGKANFTEAQIVELPDGSLRCFLRTNIGKIAYITSIDQGKTWSDASYLPNIDVASYGTQLSVINSSQTVKDKQIIIMSTPTAKDGRRAGQIMVGLINDTGKPGYDKYDIDFAFKYPIDKPTYGFSYSCLSEMPDKSIGIHYEKYDSWSRDELHLKDIQKFEKYTLEELINN